MKWTRHTTLLLAALAATSALTGCYTGDLDIDLHLVREMNSLVYHVNPEGEFTLSEGGGIVEGVKGRSIYETQLSDGDMRELKKVVQKSGFLVEPQPIRSSLTGGMFMVIKAKLGAWDNDVHVRGIRIRSVQKITEALDKHLPDRFQIRYSAAGALSEEEDYKKYLEP